MNILLDSLVDSVIVNGKSVDIETDFQPCMCAMLALQDNDLAREEKTRALTDILFYKIPRSKINQEHVEKGIWFLLGGELPDEESARKITTYSMSKDANFIYAAFQQSHRIDLQTAHLHWWKFLALFSDLGADTTFCQLVGLRQRLADGTATDAERKSADSMREIVYLDPLDNSSIQDKENYDEFMRLLGEGQK